MAEALVSLGLRSHTLGLMASLTPLSAEATDVASLRPTERELLMTCLSLRDLDGVPLEELRAAMAQRRRSGTATGSEAADLDRVITRCLAGDLSVEEELQRALSGGGFVSRDPDAFVLSDGFDVPVDSFSDAPTNSFSDDIAGGGGSDDDAEWFSDVAPCVSEDDGDDDEASVASGWSV